MYSVTYASAGCLPESGPSDFDTVEEAAEYVWSQWFGAAVDYLSTNPAASDHVAEVKDLYDRGEYDHVVEDMGADNPWPGSLYRWTIEETKREYQVHMLSDEEHVEWSGEEGTSSNVGDEWLVIEATSEAEAMRIAEQEHVSRGLGLDPNLTWFADQADLIG